MLKDYIEKFGKVANTDNARTLFKDVGYRGLNSRTVQEASSALNKDIWKHNLKNNPEKIAVLYAGSSGSGKTTAVKNVLPNQLASVSAVLDGNLSTLSSATRAIKEAHNYGKKIVIDYVYREPASAWLDGVIKRMRFNKSEGGRIVPLSIFMQNLKGSWQTIKTLSDTGFNINFIDNSLGAGKARLMSKEKFNQIKFEQNLENKLKVETKKLLDNNSITKEQYDELIK